MISPVELTRSLIRFDTINPPGNESPCAHYLGGLLEEAGFKLRFLAMEEGRENLIASKGGADGKLPLCFSGHMDVVPLGEALWTKPPFGAEIDDGKVFGRGSSDMKSGVAAFVSAALALAPRLEGTCGVVLAITVSEEDGCKGSQYIAASGVLPKVGAMVIGEPTANAVLAGHKGVLRLEGVARGVTAHGSMPHKGVNAIYKAARAVLSLEALDLSADAHEVLGVPTINVGWIKGGLNVNSVPDLARFGLDVRLVPGNNPKELTQRFIAASGGEVAFEAMSHFDPVWSDPSHPWMKEVGEVVVTITGRPVTIAGAPYFTDAAPLKPAMGHPPAVILGPGEPEQAHQTDEFCRIDRIEEAVEIYTEITRRWCGL